MSTRRRFGRVRKLPSGRWQARYAGPDGRDRPAPGTFATKTDAQRHLAGVEADMTRGRWADPQAGQVTVAEWSERWLAACAHLKPKTRATYESLLRSTVLPRFGSMQMAQVQPITVAEWLAELTERGLSPSRVRQSYRLFSQLMSAAVDNDVLTLSPCRKVRLPKMPETEPTILTVAQVEALATATRAPHDMLVYLLAYGGLRIGEAFALRREHVDLLHGRLIVAEAVTEISGRLTFGTTKAHQQRVVALPAFLTDRLAAHLDELVGPEPRALLFTGRTGKAQHYNSWRRFVFDPAAATAGLPGVTPHDLRATCATWVAADQGVMEAAKRLGHSRASVTTRHYARAVDGRDADVAAHLDEIRRAATARPVARGNLQASR